MKENNKHFLLKQINKIIYLDDREKERGEKGREREEREREWERKKIM